jgi:GNAT superfamily N-acetyltransferase
MDHDNAILIDGIEYSMSNCTTVFDMKKAIFHEVGLFVKHVQAGKTILLNSQKLFKYANTKLLGVLDEQTYTQYKEGSYRCSYCRRIYNFDLISCGHTDQCRSRARRMIISGLSCSQIDKVSISSDGNFGLIDIFNENTNEETIHSNQNNQNANNPQENKIVLNNSSLSKIKECAVDNDTENLSSIEKKNNYSPNKDHILHDSLASIEKKEKDSSNIDKISHISLDSSQDISPDNEITNNFIPNSTDLLFMDVLSEEKYPEISNLYCPAFSNISKETIDFWVRKYINIGCYLNDVLVGVVTFTLKSVVDIQFAYVYLAAVKSGMRLKGIGRKLLNQVKDRCNKIVLWSDENEGTRQFYRKNGFKGSYYLGFYLSPIIGPCDNAYFMSYNFDAETNNKILLWFKEECKREKINKKNNKNKNQLPELENKLSKKRKGDNK